MFSTLESLCGSLKRQPSVAPRAQNLQTGLQGSHARRFKGSISFQPNSNPKARTIAAPAFSGGKLVPHQSLGTPPHQSSSLNKGKKPTCSLAYNTFKKNGLYLLVQQLLLRCFSSAILELKSPKNLLLKSSQMPSRVYNGFCFCFF